MARFLALVLTTGQIPVTCLFACGDGLSAGLALATYQLLDQVVARGAVFDPVWIVGTRSTCTTVTNFLAAVLSTVKLFVADLFTRVLRRATDHLLGVHTAEAADSLSVSTRLARALMTCLHALMLAAVQRPQARLATGELGSRLHVARDSLDLLLTETSDWDTYVARGTGPWMTKNIARVVRAICVFLLVADLATTVRQDQVAVRWLREASTVTLVSR